MCGGRVKNLKAVKFGRDQTHVDIVAGRFISMGLKTKGVFGAGG